jgi:hypothetical protein
MRKNGGSRVHGPSRKTCYQLSPKFETQSTLRVWQAGEESKCSAQVESQTVTLKAEATYLTLAINRYEDLLRDIEQIESQDLDIDNEWPRFRDYRSVTRCDLLNDVLLMHGE